MITRFNPAYLGLMSVSSMGLLCMAEGAGGGNDADSGFFTLADLAAYNTDEIATLTSRLPELGLYIVAGKVATFKVGESKDGKPPLIRLGVQAEVLDFTPIKKDFDVTKVIGRTLSTSITLWPQDLEQEIGLLKGNYQKAGIPNTGPMGGVEGQPPGWVDNAVGANWAWKVSSYTDKNGEPRARFDWGPVPGLEAAQG